MSRFRSAATALMLLFLASPASAATVAIVQRHGSTSGLTETVSRIHGELLSVGLEVKMIAPPPDNDAMHAVTRPWIENISARDTIDAVIDVVGDNAPIWVDVWVIEKAPRGPELWRVAGESNTPNPERLAIRAIEVLRASFLANDMSGQTRDLRPIAKPAVAATANVPPAESPRHARRIGFGLGAALFASIDGVNPAISPVLQFDGAIRDGFGVHGELVAFGTRPTVTTPAGQARVAQQYLILGGAYRLAESGFSPFIALSAGALYTFVRGEANAQLQGHTGSQWSLLTDASLGTMMQLPGRFYASFAGHVQLAEPYVAIHILDSIVATSGRPNFGLTLTLGAWL